MSAIYALCDDPDMAQRAVNSCRSAGIPEHDITVISSEPLEEYEFSHKDKASWLFHIATLGGVCGFSFGVWLTSTTQQLWPINTGGMPIVAMYPNTIVIFELTMLGAILFTVTALLITTKLPRRQPKLYDPAVSDGKILVGIENPTAALSDIERALRASGAAQIKTLA